jgi:hypothetical protein
VTKELARGLMVMLPEDEDIRINQVVGLFG